MIRIDPRRDGFTDFFKIATDGFKPYGWQTQVALDGLPDVLAVPTGLGKTEIALAWAWRLLIDKQPEPLHLVVCLPMRSLVTQTVRRLKTYFDALKANYPDVDVRVHQLQLVGPGLWTTSQFNWLHRNRKRQAGKVCGRPRLVRVLDKIPLRMRALHDRRPT